MSAQPVDDSDLDDLLPDDLSKGAAVPLKRTPKQTKALAKQDAKAREAALLKTNAVRLAQIVNLHIAGFSLADIGASIGASAEEVDRILTQDAARYVRSQPALRTYVRNWVSGKYTAMIEADWEAASDKDHPEKLEHQDRVLRLLNNIAKLHGAEAPVQSEVKIDAAPESVDKIVAALASGRGLTYDTDIFDIEPDDIHEAVVVADAATEVSGNAVEDPQEGDPDEGL